MEYKLLSESRKLNKRGALIKLKKRKNQREVTLIRDPRVVWETNILLFIKTSRNIFSYGGCQYDKTSTYTVSLNFSDGQERVLQYQKIWNEVELQLLEKLTLESIKRESKYMHGKLKTWKESTKTIFHGQGVPYERFRNAPAELNVDSV